MKVMHIEAGRNLYGGALQVYYLLRELKENKNVSNILVCPPGSAIAKESRCFAQVEETAMGGDLDFFFVFRLLKLIKKYEPDVLHIHSRRGADVWGGIASRISGIASILTRRVDNREPPWFARTKSRWFKKVVAISEGIRTVQISEGIPKDHVVTIRSAVDTEKFFVNRDREVLRERFGYESGDIVIAVVAQLIERKGHRYLFEIVPQLLKDFSNVKVLVLGKGAKEAELKKEVEVLGLSQTVCFAGFHGDIENILPHVDIVVHPALMEGLGVALLQASACGVPIVAGNAGGIPEVVRDGVNGFLVRPADSSSIMEKLSILLRDDVKRAEFGKAGRELVEQEFSIQRMAEQNFQLYQSTID